MTHPGEVYSRPNDRLGPSSTARRVSVPEAAEILGTTTDAVRSRMRRGKLRREEGEDGTVYVLLDRCSTASDGRETVEDGPLAERMASEIDHLRGQLEEAHAANRENRRIIAALTSRIPQLEPPRGERYEPESAAEEEPVPRPRPAMQSNLGRPGGVGSSAFTKAPLFLRTVTG